IYRLWAGPAAGTSAPSPVISDPAVEFRVANARSEAPARLQVGLDLRSFAVGELALEEHQLPEVSTQVLVIRAVARREAADRARRATGLGRGRHHARGEEHTAGEQLRGDAGAGRVAGGDTVKAREARAEVSAAARAEALCLGAEAQLVL